MQITKRGTGTGVNFTSRTNKPSNAPSASGQQMGGTQTSRPSGGGKNAPKPIFSIEELNHYDQFEQAHKLQITSKLASSRFLVDDQARALGLQAVSIGQSSSGLFKQGASLGSSVDTILGSGPYAAYSGSPRVTSSQLHPDPAHRTNGRGAASSVGGKNGKQRKVTAMPPSYAERMARAAIIQAKRDKEEAKRMKALRKQERQFHRMMQNLKNKQQYQGESPTEDSDMGDYGEESSSGSEEETATENLENNASKNEQMTARKVATEKSTTRIQDSSPNHLMAPQGAINATDQAKSVVTNPFENTPHCETVAGYLEEARRLQTLHLSSDRKDQLKVLQDVRSAGFEESRNKQRDKISATDPMNADSSHSGHPGLHHRSREQPGSLEGQLLSLNTNQTQRPQIIQAERLKQFKKNIISSSALDIVAGDVQPPFSKRTSQQPETVQKKRETSPAGSGKATDDNFYDFSFHKQTSAHQMESCEGMVGGGFRFTSGSDLEPNKGHLRTPKSHIDPFVPTIINSRKDSGSQMGKRGFFGADVPTTFGYSPIKAGPTAQALVRDVRFQHDLDKLRKSHNIPQLFKGQRDVNAEYFRKCFDKAANNYSFLLEPQRRAERSKRLNRSMNFGEIRDQSSNNSRLVLPSIHQSQVQNANDNIGSSSLLLKVPDADKSKIQSQYASPHPPQIKGPDVLKLETGAIKAAQITNQLIRIENQLSHFSSAFMKSPKLKSELIKCQQLLQNKSKFLALQNSNFGQGAAGQLNTRDKLKQIYKFSGQHLFQQPGTIAEQQQVSDAASSHMGRATASLIEGPLVEVDVPGSKDDIRVSPPRTLSRDDSQDNTHIRDTAPQSPYIKFRDSVDQHHTSPARSKETAQKQGKARFVKKQPGELSYERSTESLGKGSRTSKLLQSPSPARSTNFKKKKPFKTEQQLEQERQQREVEAFEKFVSDYEKPREEVLDPASQIELYRMKGVQEIIQLADHLVKYRENKAEKEKEKIANMPEQERRTLDMVITARRQSRPINIKRVSSSSPPKKPIESILKKEHTQTSQKSMYKSLEKKVSKKLSLNIGQTMLKNLSSIDSEFEGHDSSMNITQNQDSITKQPIGKRPDRDKHPELCVVQKKALKFMHNQYVDDDRYEVDPGEAKRARYLDMSDIEDIRYHLTEEQQKQLFQKVQQIDCREHSQLQNGEAEFEQLLFKKLAAFYGDLLDDKHNKVALENLCQVFVEQIKEKKDVNFKHLRDRLSKLDIGDLSFYEQLRAVNPEMFLKVEKLSKEYVHKMIRSSQLEKVQVMNARQHHIHCLNPMQQVFVNKMIFETLIEGMVGHEFEEENAELAKLRPVSSQNKFLQQNQRRRDQEKERKQQEREKQRQLKRQSRSFTGESSKSEDSQPASDEFKKMSAGLLEGLQQRLSEQEHFEQQTKLQILQREQTQHSREKARMMDMIVTEKAKRNYGDQSSPYRNKEEDVKKYTKKNTRNTKELFLKEFDKQKFYAEQKHYSGNPSLNPGSQTEFFLQLNEEEKHCLVQPHFTLIQNSTLHLRDNFLNSTVVKALANYIKTQTASCFRKLALIAQDTDFFDEDVTEEIKALREINIGQVFIETLTIDDCQMVDQDLAILLEVIAKQGHLRSITIANNQFGQHSIAVLEDILKQKFKSMSRVDVTVMYENEQRKIDANPFQPLDTLNLTNLKCNKSQCLKVVTALAETAVSWPLKAIKLSGLDLSDLEIGIQLGTLLEGNPHLLKLDLSFSKMFPNQLAGFTKYLAYEASNAGNLRLQHLSLGYINIENEGSIQSLDGGNAASSQQPASDPANDKIANQIIEDLSVFIGNARCLLHLDISGMNLRERVFTLLNSALTNECHTIAAIHLHDNRFTLEQKDRILRFMGIEANNYHHLKDSLNLHEQDTIGHTILSRHFVKQDKIFNMAHQFFKTDTDNPPHQSILSREKSYQLKVVNNELTQEMKETHKQIKTDVAGGLGRDRTIKDPMILTRKIGQPELIFNDKFYCAAELNAANSEEKWSFNDSVNGDDCYVCQQHNYVQIFFNREKAHLDFKKITDRRTHQALVQFYDLDKNESLQRGTPILLSSVNNWILTRLLDVKILSQLLKADDEAFSKMSAQVQKKSLKAKIDKEKERLQQKTKAKAQPKGSVAKRNDPDEEALFILEDESKYIDSKFIEDEVQQAKTRADNIRRSIAYQGSATFHALIGVNALKQTKEYDPTDTSRIPLGSKKQNKPLDIQDQVNQHDIVDQYAAQEWRQIFQKCQKYRHDLVSVNQPTHDVAKGDIFIFAGFIKPGRHVIIIYDPVQGEFYRKDLIVEVRKGEIIVQSAKQAQNPSPNAEEQDVCEQVDFIFREWRKDDDITMQSVIAADLTHQQFNSKTMRLSPNLFFEMKELISVAYPRLLDAYKIYLCDGNYPSSSMQKFLAFLKEIGLVKGRTKGAPSKQNLMSEDDVIRKFYNYDQFKSNSKPLEELKRHVVYRQEFVRILFSIAYHNFTRYYPDDNSRMVPYCQQTVLSALQKYIKKQGGSHNRFRFKHIWTKPVHGVLSANRSLLRQMYQKYLIGGKFTITSLLKMLEQMDILLNRRESATPPITHQEMAKRLFGASKQTQVREDDLYFYGFLTEVEFYELIVRLTNEVYHQSLAIESDDGEAGVEDVAEEVPRGKLATVTGDPKATLRLRILAVEPLEYKIFEFLSTDFAACLDSVAVKDIEGVAPEESLAKKKKLFTNAGLDQLKKLKAAADLVIQEQGDKFKINDEGSTEEYEEEKGESQDQQVAGAAQ